MANISFTDRQPRHSDARTCQHDFQTEVDCGFNLPSAYKSCDDRLGHIVAMTVLVASVGIAAVSGLQIVGLI